MSDVLFISAALCFSVKIVFAFLPCSSGGKINHYLVAFANKKLTINGEQYFDNLPELVKVSGQVT